MVNLNNAENSAKAGWGAWRKFIAANPLTGTWIMFAVGMVLMYFLRSHLP